MHHEQLASFAEAFDKIEAVKLQVIFVGGDSMESSVIPYTDDLMADLHEDLMSFHEGHPLAIWNKEQQALSYVYLRNVREVKILPVTIT
jgi:hypothetical protein